MELLEKTRPYPPSNDPSFPVSPEDTLVWALEKSEPSKVVESGVRYLNFISMIRK